MKRKYTKKNCSLIEKENIERNDLLSNLSKMPEISRFLGIVIRMYFREHAPPHFHAEYGDYEITVEIQTGVVTGKFPKRALRAVLEWHEEHKSELLKNWDLAIEQQPLHHIEPLE